MSIASKLEKLQSDISNAYDTIELKGGTIPQDKNTENLVVAIESISAEPVSKDHLELEYIQSSGDQYINTEIAPTNNTVVDMTYNKSSLTIRSWETHLGITAIFECIRRNATNTIYFRINNVDLSAQYTENANTVYHIKFGNQKLIVNDSQIATYTNTFSTTRPIWLFRSNNQGGGNVVGDSIIFYGCKIYENDTMVRNFIPVYRISDSAICLYDTVTKEYFLNQGSGRFVAGPEK